MFKLKRFFLLLVCLIFAAALAGCGSGGVGGRNENSEQNSITVAGSTSVQPLSEELALAFEEKNEGVKINTMGGGSSQGIKSANDGIAEIGTSSRNLKEEEKDLGLNTVTIALDGIAIVVHPNSDIKDLTVEQIRKIFAGEIKNWKEVGGKNANINVVTREEGSGTRGAFEELVMGEEVHISDTAAVQPSNGAVRATVAGDELAIGYLSFGYVNSNLKTVNVEGVEPTAENIKSGTYKISRPFLYLIKGEADGLAKEYINFVLSDEGQEIVSKDYISVK